MRASKKEGRISVVCVCVPVCMCMCDLRPLEAHDRPLLLVSQHYPMVWPEIREGGREGSMETET